MPDGNTLIAPEKPVSDTAGAGAIDTVATAAKAIGDGNWAEGLVNSFSAASAVSKLIDAGDPLAGLAAAGFGWLIEHVSFLKEPLDKMVGDQQAIDAMSATWGNVAKEVSGAADDITKAVQTDTAPWEGVAIDAYKVFAAGQVAIVNSVSTGCQAVSIAVSMAGGALNAVRKVVRELISQAVGDLVAAAIEWAAAEVISVGLATPGMVADIVRRAVKWAKKIAEWTSKLIRVVKKICDLVKRLELAIDRLKGPLDKAIDAKGMSKPLADITKGIYTNTRKVVAKNIDKTYNQ
ncbi:hypothetical protein [Actinocrispum wychmicini]|uniref:Type VII secretion system (Wss) protein ESAT-6 n=1 Tax=Actinocrispum wychmicini TaxID=1213861 RepID=A0A4R2K070_9PSEU|nr:hypothetical protein [Actinocrispum wychmicini]TCO65664.1 hypothetical protein EV192_1011456 [Actinocrispum wychmicini]